MEMFSPLTVPLSHKILKILYINRVLGYDHLIPSTYHLFDRQLVSLTNDKRQNIEQYISVYENLEHKNVKNLKIVLPPRNITFIRVVVQALE